MTSMRSATLVALAVACPSAWPAEEAFRRGMYEIVAHYGMPHLDENLRHARSKEFRCLSEAGELSTLFPVLRDSSMQGCTLAHPLTDERDTSYRLVCSSSQAPTGTARLQVQPGHVSGMLQVKGGGKNMTYSQSVVATRTGDCQSP